MRRDGGFTVVEVLVGLFILVLGAVAVLTALDAATRNTFRVDQRQVAINRAQLELEKIRQMDYKDVALKSAPAFVDDSQDPRYRVNGQGQYALGWNGNTASNYAALDVDLNSDPTKLINPGPTTFTSGNVTGKVFRFVVWQDDPNCVVCLGTHDYKRVIVAVKLDSGGAAYTQNYLELQSNVTDPDANTLSGQSPTGGPALTTQQFFLSDTRCYNANADDWPARDQAGDHPIHNTLGGACGTVANPGTSAPDGLYPSAPTDPDPDRADIPTEYEYASDLSPPPPARGLQMPRQPTCDSGDSGGGSEYRIHRWVSQPMASNFIISGGQGSAAAVTLKLWTATTVPSQTAIRGGICAWLFVRNPTTGIDVYLPNTDAPTLLDPSGHPYFTLTENNWPQSQWTAAPAFLMNTTSGTVIPAGSRLGVAIAVNGQVTAANQDVLEFMYDYPDEASRLEVQTTTPLP